MTNDQKEPNYKQILINLCAGACLADHLGDINSDINEALIQAKLITSDEAVEFEDSNQRTYFLVTEYAATTLYGTELSND